MMTRFSGRWDRDALDTLGYYRSNGELTSPQNRDRLPVIPLASRYAALCMTDYIDILVHIKVEATGLARSPRNSKTRRETPQLTKYC